MSWADYKAPSTTVDDGQGTQRPVRGLSLEDLGQLATNHIDGLMRIAELYIASQKDILATKNISDLYVAAAAEFPGMVSEVISLVTDSPELKKVSLGAALQLRILSAAFRITVEDAGGMGNLSATLSAAVKQAVAARGGVSQKL